MHNQVAEMADQVRTNLKEMHTDLNTGGSIFRKEFSKPRKHR